MPFDCCLKGVSHRNYVYSYVVLCTDYAELFLPYALPMLAYVAIRRGTQRAQDGHPILSMLSTQFLRKSTQLYAIVRHAYAIVRYCVK